MRNQGNARLFGTLKTPEKQNQYWSRSQVRRLSPAQPRAQPPREELGPFDPIVSVEFLFVCDLIVG